MEDTFQKIADKYGCQLNQTIGKFDLSHEVRNIPCMTTTIIKHNEKLELLAECISLWGTSQSSSYFSGNTPNQFKVSIRCYYKATSPPAFSIADEGLLRKLFFKKNFKVYCKHSDFANALKDDFALQNLYALAKEEGELSPYIECKNGRLNINYQAFYFNEHVFDAALLFCHDLIE